MRRSAVALALLLLLLPSAACSTAGSGDDTPATDADLQAADAHPSDAAPVSELAAILDELRSDKDGALLRHSAAQGWPLAVEDGYLFVSSEGLTHIAGDFNDWQPQALIGDQGFSYAVIAADHGARYKFTDGQSDYRPDPWSRSYAWDDQGEMSTVHAQGAHLERLFRVGSEDIPDRRLRIFVPAEPATHLLYVHDGQNLFNPYANFGGWHLDQSAPAGLMLVGIDNSGDRMNEYTHVSQGAVGGKGDAYADYVENTVRARIDAIYGEPDRIGTMGSSLGGLISLHIADRYPGRYDFVASLSGTVGWGSMGTQGTDTIIKRYQDAGHRGTALYIDSGGNGDSCADSDGDGTNDDDPSASDNYCENRQLESVLVGLGYTYDADLWHWWEPNAAHNEAAWAARVFRPMQNFVDLE